MRANATRHLQQVGEEALLYRRQAVPGQMSRLHVNQVLPQRESNGNIAEKHCSMGAKLHCLLQSLLQSSTTQERAESRAWHRPRMALV